MIDYLQLGSNAFELTKLLAMKLDAIRGFLRARKSFGSTSLPPSSHVTKRLLYLLMSFFYKLTVSNIIVQYRNARFPLKIIVSQLRWAQRLYNYAEMPCWAPKSFPPGIPMFSSCIDPCSEASVTLALFAFDELALPSSR